MGIKRFVVLLILFSGSLNIPSFGAEPAVIDTAHFQQYLDSALVAEGNAQYQLAKSWIKKAEELFDENFPNSAKNKYYYTQGVVFLATWQLAKAEDAFLRAIAVASTLKDSSALMADYSGLATAFSSQGRVQEAIKNQKMALRYFTSSDSSKYYSLLNNMALSYEASNETEKALQLYFKVKRFYKSSGKYAMQAIVENNLGEIYRTRREDPITARVYYYNAIKLNMKAESKAGLIRDYHNLGLSYAMTGQLDSSFFYLRKSLRYRKEAGGRGGMAILLYALADNYLESGQLDSAEWAYNETLSISQEMGIEQGGFYANGGLGRLYVETGNTKKAEYHYLEALKVAENMGSLDFKKAAFSDLYEFYKASNNSAAALDAYERYQAVADSINTIEKEEELEELLAKYQIDLAEAENETLRAEQGMREAQITRQYGFLIGLSVVLVVLVAGWAILVRAFRQRNQAFVEVVEAKRELQVQYDRTKEQELKLIEASSLKNRIFSVLGHDLRAPLVNISSMLELISADTISKDELTWIFRHLRRDTDQSINTLNNILQWSQMQMSDLRVQREKVEIKGAFSDLKEIFESSTRLKNISLNFEDLSENGQIWVDPNQFRSIATNLISNAIKFSPVGEEVSISISENERYSILEISDNGEGFPDDPVPISGNQITKTTEGTLGETGTGVGLQIARDFVEAHQGKMVMSKNQKGGARVEVYFPRTRDDMTQSGAKNSLRTA